MLPTAGPEVGNVVILTPWKSTTPKSIPGTTGRGGGQRKGNHQAQGKKRGRLKCYNCQKTGHYARDCRGRKVQPQQREAEMQPYEVNVMTRTENEPPIETIRDAYDTSSGQNQHAILHWTACYEDYCTTHWSCKNGSGYFLSQPRKHRRELNVIEKQGTLWDSIMYLDSTDDDVIETTVIPPEEGLHLHSSGRMHPCMKPQKTLPKRRATTKNQIIPVHQPTNQVTMTGTEDLGVIPEIDNSEAANESTPEDSEEEYSDDDAPGDNELLHFSVEGPEPIRRMVLHLAR
ncbi:hypothetical protein LTR02_017707 [Friedmanniomyces endolithicus]|nr:hypothetical protein LTR75_017746 [Friedmanniomyces endolithicus]KAK0824510.1 hypothetical protein LTR03_017714 [Friedmanniomyces endolithicus]KAK0839323.1 hypothetical protein LTS02_017529 [Friedmanniomyces endolithicus]KAK0859391.1 hypothetical protein LTR87_017613 [Friedmanniomyces endolithicus]KAK0886922.1 hypothetical protein LTR02_017707 [Friedmanniomyces endolithicus]